MSLLDIVTCDNRFIPKRSLINHDFCDYVLKSKDEHKTGKVLLTKKTLNIRDTINSINYRETLYKMLFPERARMLNFTHYNNTIDNYTFDMPQWNVDPRKSPLITTPIAILDMPNITLNLTNNPVDWSSRGILATVFDNEIYTTREDFKSDRHTNTLNAIECCVKWNRSGERFACAMTGGKISVWDYVTFKEIHQNHCIGTNCTITRIEWDNNDRLITGCTESHILHWSNDLNICISCLELNEGPIIFVELSHDESYLAISTLHGNINVTEWTLNTKSAHKCLVLNYKTPTKAIKWHPDKNWLAVGGEGDGGALAIININLGEVMYVENLGAVYNKDAIAWNPISKELVVSTWKKNENNNEVQGAIIILSSLTKIVDSIQTNDCRVPYLMWGQNGNLLATVSADETLNVWKFFGDKTNSLCKNNNNYCYCKKSIGENYEYDFKHIIKTIR